MTDMQRLASSHEQGPAAASHGTKHRAANRARRVAFRVALCGGAVAAAAFSPGCNLVNPPQPEPRPTEVPTPKPDLFDAADGVTALAPLNGAGAAGAPLPAKFRVVNVLPGQMLQLQALYGTAPNWQVGASDLYRLAGIVTPAQGQPGYAEMVRFISERTLGAGKEVDVEQDPRFPQDLNTHRMVQVYYTQKTALSSEKRLLNRMMVRQGFAVVDINAPTSIDVRSWLNDEEFARKKKLGLNALGITIAQRIPLRSGGIVLQTAPQAAPAPPRRPGNRPVSSGAAGAAGSTGATVRGGAIGASPSASQGAAMSAPAAASAAAPGASPGASMAAPMPR